MADDRITVRAPNGAIIDIDPRKTWYKFKRGDVVTSENEDSQWFGKRVVLEGVDKDAQNIVYGTVAGQNVSYFTNEPRGLILLERPGYKFKADDRANFCNLSYIDGHFKVFQEENGQCTIVAINPTSKEFLIKNDRPLPLRFWLEDWMPAYVRNAVETGFYYVVSADNLLMIEEGGSTMGDNKEFDELEAFFSGSNRDTANEEIIIDVDRIPHPIDKTKTIFGFKAGDIITCDEGELAGKRIRVRGVETGGYLFGEVIGEPRVLRTNHAEGLILLERPNFMFKVGDRVYSSFNEGTVRILNPQDIEELFVETEGDIHHCIIPGFAPCWLPQGSEKKPPWFPIGYYCERNDKNIKNRCVMSAFLFLPGPLQLRGRQGQEYRGTGSEAAESFIKEQFPDGQAEALEAVQPAETLAETSAEPAVVFPVPAWFEELSVDIQAKRAHFFIVHGNIYDWQKNPQGRKVTLRQYFRESYRDCLVIYYSLSEGISFGSADDEQWFRNRLAPAQEADAAGSARQKLAQKVQGARAQGGSLAELVGRAPDAVLPMLERLLAADEKEAPKKRVLVIESAHNIAPRQITPAERATVETLERWARDERFRDSGSLIFLTTPFKGQIAESLSSSFSGARSIRVPKPDEAGRIRYWQEVLAESGLELAESLTAESLGRLTGGLSLRQIDDLCALAKVKAGKIEVNFIKNEKRRILDDEFGDRLKIKVPTFGFESFGGKENVRAYLLQVRDDILKGILRRVPMGILASGPPGTGKTFLFECWASECGFNFVEIENVRSKWVGESEEMMEKILNALDDLSPVIVVEDEADQSEPSRDAPSGDSGVSSRLRQMKFKFCGEPKRRGRVVWVRISNRDDLLDSAYKRKGRTDANIPFVLPSEAEYAKIFEVMFKRYSIATTVVDFAPLAQKVSERVYCTGADVEWMVLKADKLSANEGKESVEPAHLERAISSWEMDLNPDDVDNQIIIAFEGSDEDLRPENWEQQVADAKRRLEERAKALLPPLSAIQNGQKI
jgi:hypothetical protein